MIYILLNSFIISAWCLGFRTITDEGMILNWLRKPFEKLEEQKFYYSRQLAYLTRNNGCDNYSFETKIINSFLYLMKPFILCVVCFPSVHGTFIYYHLHGWEWTMIISIVFSCFINAFVWNLYEKIRG